MGKRILSLGLMGAICLCFPLLAFAHTMWLNASDYSPEIYPGYGARTKVYFGWGHGYPVDDFLPPKALKEFSLICPCGKKKVKLEPNPGGFLATEVKLKGPGVWTVTAALKPGFYTMYVEKGKVHHKAGPKTGLKGVILSLYYEQYAKALICAGETTGTSPGFKKPVGHKLEIVPLESPDRLRVGDYFPLQVLFEGKPARYCQVLATYSGFSTGDDFAYATSTDGRGKAKVRLLHHGPWLIKASMRLPAPKELRGKCDQLHYTATLTFEVP